MKLNCSYRIRPHAPSCNTAYVQSVFGLGPAAGENVIARDVDLDYEPGRIVLFVGPSGSGKSTLLRAAADQAGPTRWLATDSDDGRSLIDSLLDDPRETAALLSRCGLAEATLMLRRPAELSDGQRYRFGLARALAAGAPTVVADEWCAALDRATAQVICRNVRTIADRDGVGFLLATTHEDLTASLDPDTLVRCLGGGAVEVRPGRPFRGASDLLARLEITDGSVSDWPYFARWHYRGHTLGPVRQVRLLWDGPEPVGVCVLGFGALSSAARNRIFGLGQLGRREAARIVNCHFAAVTRLVIDPRYRGAGVAHRFLRAVCRQAPWPWIELVSEMAHLVPFAAAAGFVLAGVGRDKTRTRSGRFRTDLGGGSAGGFSAANCTAAARARFRRRVRFSRPAYYLLDNRSARAAAGEPVGLTSAGA